MKALLTIVAIVAALVFLVPETEAKIDKNQAYNSRNPRSHVGSYGMEGYKIYSSSPAIRYRHNLGRKYRYHHERPYPYFKRTPRYFSGSPYYANRGYYRYGSYGRYSGYNYPRGRGCR